MVKNIQVVLENFFDKTFKEIDEKLQSLKEVLLEERVEYGKQKVIN